MRCLIRTILLLALSGVGLAHAALQERPPQKHALLIGIDEYQHRDQISRLYGAASDARALAEVLREAAGVPPENIQLLTSDAEPRPTWQNIVEALRRLQGVVRPGDTVFFAYSGHGMERDGMTYFVPYDADIQDAVSLRSTLLTTRDVIEKLRPLPAHTLVLFYDMCRDDPLAKASRSFGAPDPNLLSENQVRDLIIKPARGGPGPEVVLNFFACSPGQRSWEMPGKNRGFFSYFLEQALRREAADPSGEVRLPKLVQYVSREVDRAVRLQLRQDQKPAYSLDGREIDVLLAKVAPRPDPGIEQRQRLEALLAKGYALLHERRYEEARRSFEEALRLEPRSPSALFGLGKVALAKKELPEAARYYRQALQLNPYVAYGYIDLGDILLEQKDYAGADTCYNEALRLEKDNPVLLHKKAKLEMELRKDFPAAATLLQAAAAIDPTKPEYRVDLALCLAEMQRFDDARQQMEMAKQLGYEGPGPAIAKAEPMKPPGPAIAKAEPVKPPAKPAPPPAAEMPKAEPAKPPAASPAPPKPTTPAPPSAAPVEGSKPSFLAQIKPAPPTPVKKIPDEARVRDVALVRYTELGDLGPRAGEEVLQETLKALERKRIPLVPQQEVVRAVAESQVDLSQASQWSLSAFQTLADALKVRYLITGEMGTASMTHPASTNYILVGATVRVKVYDAVAGRFVKELEGRGRRRREIRQLGDLAGQALSLLRGAASEALQPFLNGFRPGPSAAANARQ